MGSVDFGWGVSQDQQDRKKGPWTPEEDRLLTQYVSLHGDGRWTSVSKFAGLNRSGKSCRLRWVNYLRPGLKRGQITPIEEAIIMELHALWGNKWSTIARYLPGRTDNEIKNYWRTHFLKKEKTPDKQEKPRAKSCIKLDQNQGARHQEVKRFDNVRCHHQVQGDGDARMGVDTQVAEQATSFTSLSLEDQQFWTTPMFLDNMGAWWDPIMEEDELLWDGLWNLDDDHHPPLKQGQ